MSLLVRYLAHHLARFHATHFLWRAIRGFLPSSVRQWLSRTVSTRLLIRSPNISTEVPNTSPNLLEWERLYNYTVSLKPTVLSEDTYSLTGPPMLFSILLPVYKVDPQFLDAAIQSVITQTYIHWELCLIWGDSENVTGWNLLEKAYAKDPRIRMHNPGVNLGISGNSNLALSQAQGEYVILLDHDDTLSVDALSIIHSYICTYPDVDFLYSDKDQLNSTGTLRHTPFFKPRPSPHVMYSANYVTHVNAVKTSVLRTLGGWEESLDGAQDWDIYLKIFEGNYKIIHVPHILYHWRVHPSSTATGLAAKPYAAIAQLATLSNHFQRQHLAVDITPTGGLFHINWKSVTRSVDIILTNGYSPELITQLHASFQEPQNNVQLRFFVTQVDYSRLRNSAALHTSISLLPLQSRTSSWSDLLLAYFLSTADAFYVVILDASAIQWSNSLIQELTGWLEYDHRVSWSSGIATTADGIVLEAGRCAGLDNHSAPLFRGLHKANFGIFGAANWYRNATACSPFAFASRRSDLSQAYWATQHVSPSVRFTAICLQLSSTNMHGLINPFVEIIYNTDVYSETSKDGRYFREDKYLNPHFVQVVPLRIMI